MEKIWFLSRLDLFHGISEQEVRGVAERAREIRATARTILYTPFDGRDRAVFIVTEGEGVLFHSTEGKRTTFDVLGPGALFGNFIPDGQPVSHYAEAMPGSRICVFAPEDLQQLVRSHPEMLGRLLRRLMERVQDYEDRMHELRTEAPARVLAELKRYARKKRHPCSSFTGQIPLVLSHERIAELTGLNRVTVTRAIKFLRNQQMISMDNRGRLILHEHMDQRLENR